MQPFPFLIFLIFLDMLTTFLYFYRQIVSPGFAAGKIIPRFFYRFTFAEAGVMREEGRYGL